MKKLTIIISAMVLLASCSKQSDDLTSPSSSNQVSEKTERPFTATFYATPDTNSPPTECSGDLPGFSAADYFLSGTATHLGLIDAQLSKLHHVSCNLSFATALLTTHVTVDLVAANGDVVHINGDDVVDVANLLTAAGTSGAITGAWTVDGGSGRFIDATGSLTINGTVDLVFGSFSCECTG